MFRFMTTLFAVVVTTSCTVNMSWGGEPKIAIDANATTPLKAGEKIPDVVIHDNSGEGVSLHSLIEKDAPTVIVFFRGSWCPICTRHFQDLIKIHPKIVEHGAKVIAISPDTAENSKANAESLNIPFPLYSDSDVKAASAFGLAFQVGETTLIKYNKFGIDLEKASGRNHHALPVPAVYIVDQAGKIQFAHSNPDYSKRLEGAKILAELKKLPK
ncbi:peroxiredoxin-like family protein [Rubinisphaera italica]|uniref:thioredoxin-dependent peroxiredoxin n=1 Tax=Rubinisphaera italica TaxID=2527969 RepID=A0A5C5XM41_9PLAN|nr:peroxiredoxin-like family protein [Rubinisphaera italica]TWT64030.1 putative peroxiredoxin [Rubinisphaera italica]